MDLESFLVIGFDLGTLLQGQMRIGKLKSAYNLLMSRLLLVLQVLDIKPTYRSSWFAISFSFVILKCFAVGLHICDKCIYFATSCF